MRFAEHVLHENSDLLMKFQKEDEKNALLTEQNERQVLFCTVTSWLLHDDAKIYATSAWLYNVLENWGDENRFPPKYFDPDRRSPDFILYFSMLRLDLHSA